MSNNNIMAIMGGFLCLSLTGCGSISDYEPLGSGYIWVTYTENSISEPSAHQFELQYSPGKGKWWVKVWPDLSPSHIVVKDGVAVFVGERTSKRRQHFYEPWPSESRLFAVKAPDLPLDLTDEALHQWCKETGRDFEKISEKASIGLLEKSNDGVEFHYTIWPNSSADFSLGWGQITNIMREVKEKGIVCKDLRWGTKYITTTANTALEPTPTAP